MDTPEVLIELGAVLIGLSLLARLAGRLRLSAIPFYLLEFVGPVAVAYVLILAVAGPLAARWVDPLVRRFSSAPATAA